MDTPAQPAPLETVARIPRHPHISGRRAGMVIGALLFASAVCVGLVVLRKLFVGYASYRFLIWNLILAWIPLLFAATTYSIYVMRRLPRWLFMLCACAWFVFFPNAPYMVTDFVHISPIHIAPEWLDIITVIACAWTGLCLGFLSLYLMQEIVRRRLGAPSGWIFALVMLGMGSIGVFCGRFLRWNSWDVLKNPFGMLHEAHSVHRFSQPTDPLFILTLFSFLLLSYLVLFALTHLRASSEPTAL